MSTNNLERISTNICDSRNKIKTLRKEYGDVKYSEERQECLEKMDREKKDRENKMCVIRFNLERLATIRFKLEKIFKFHFESAEDTLILEMGENFKLVETQFKNFTDIATEILKGFPSESDEENIKTSVKIDHSGIAKLKDEYERNLKIELKLRDLNSVKMAPTSVFNIKLERFCGYDSSVDIFTFKDKFEKLYLTCTQKHHLPDLLKNNYLEGLALTLVKGIKKTDEIWKRLVRAFGNPELLLKGKLREAE